MNKIKEYIKFLVIFLISLILLAFVNYFAFNIKIMHQSPDNVGIIDIEDRNIEYNGFEKKGNKLVSTKENATIVLNIAKYVENLNFNYNSDDNLNIEEKIDFYEDKILKTKNDSSASSKNINLYSKSIRKSVYKMTLTFDSKGIEVYNFKVNNEKKFNWYTFIFFSIILFDFYYLIFKRKKLSTSPEKLFLLISISAGIIFSFVIPPMIGSGWDEQHHFNNSNNASLNINENYNEAIYEFYNMKTTYSMADTIEERNLLINTMNKLEKQKIDMYKGGTSSYKSIVFLPSAIMLFVTKKIGLSFTLSFILSKFINLILYVFIAYHTIKILPKYKYLFTYISLFPMTLFIASQYTYDVIVNSFLFLAFAIFLKEKSNTKDKLNYKNIIIFVISVILASIAKAIYIPFILLLLLLPKEKFKSNKNRKIFILGILVLFIILLISFVKSVSPLVSLEGDVRGGNTSVTGQIDYILHNIVIFVAIFIKNIASTILENLFTTMNFAYYGQIKIFTMVGIMIAGLMFFFVTDDNENKILNKKDKICIFVIMSLIICFIYGAMYLSFTPVGNKVINGVQSRYFIPLLFPLLCCLKPINVKCNIDKVKYSFILYFFITICIYGSIYILIINNYCF